MLRWKREDREEEWEDRGVEWGKGRCDEKVEKENK